MKVTIDPKIDPYEDVIKQINLLYNKSKDINQSILDTNTTYICEKCGCNLLEKYDKDTAQKIFNFCGVKYKGKIYCKDCQATLGGGST